MKWNDIFLLAEDLEQKWKKIWKTFRLNDNFVLDRGLRENEAE